MHRPLRAACICFYSLADTDDLVILIPRYFFTITYMGTHTAHTTAYSAHVVVFSVVNGQNITVLFHTTILYQTKNNTKKTKLAHAVLTLIPFSYYQYITTTAQEQSVSQVILIIIIRMGVCLIKATKHELFTFNFTVDLHTIQGNKDC